MRDLSPGGTLSRSPCTVIKMHRRVKNSMLVFLLLHLTALYCSVGSVEQCSSHAVPCPASESTSGCGQQTDCCFSMVEEQEVGIIVGNVNVVSVLNDILINGSGSISQTGGDDFFNVSTTTGDVTVNSRVDREDIERSCITISISAMLPGRVSLSTVGVIVQDINDNPPEFSETPADYERPEGLLVSLCIGGYPGLEAIDIDSAPNAMIEYSLGVEEGSEKFEITDNCIVNNVILDRDAVADPSNTPVYLIQLTLEATDGVHTSSTTLNIRVTDVNDIIPVLTESSLARVQVREDANNGIVIRDLNATDLDVGDILTFSLETNGVPFALDESNGKLSLVKSDNNFSPGTHNLDIAVSDIVGHTNRSTLAVDILDVNDKAEINLFSESSLIEETEPSHFLLRYRILDMSDTAENEYVVEFSGLHAESFTAQPKTVGNLELIDITLTHSIDQELIRGDPDGNSIIELVIEIQEIGPFINYTHELQQNITVIGLNDNLPFIEKTEFSVQEGGENIIGDLQIIDLDSGINGTITDSSLVSALAFPDPLSLTSAALDRTEKFLQVNPGNRTTLVSPSLDREVGIEVIIVTMKLTDGGGETNYMNLTVHLRDINDNCPVFANNPKIKFNEGEVEGVQGRVTATDPDSEPNAEVLYKLLNSTDLFFVDALTGEVVANGTFDREQKDNHEIMIEARNSQPITGDPKCEWNTIAVTVLILDVNDNNPVWENTGTTFDVFSDSPVGTLVITLSANDADQGSTITYEIQPNNLFQMDEHSGIITVGADLSDKFGSHSLMVTASDGKNTVQQNITITVKTPEAASPLTQPVIIGITVGLCTFLVVAILVTTAIILYCVFLEKRKQSLKISKRNGRMEIDGINSPARGILRQIPATTNSGLNGRASSACGSNRGVKFEKTVQKYGYDYESNGSGVYVTQSAIHLDSSGDESPVTPPRPPSAPSHHHHHNGKLPAMGRHSHTNGGPVRLSPIHEDTLFHSYPYHPHPMQDDYSDDSEGNSEDDESTLPDNASSTNAPLPNTRHLSHMASSPRSTPPNSHLGPHLPMAQISPSHQFTRSPDHGPGGLNPPRIDNLSVHSSSSDSLTVTPPPVHSHMSHENPRLRPPGRSSYPVHMPEGYVVPPASSSRYNPFMDQYGGTDFGDASTYTSADLDDALHFNPDQEPGNYSLTATSSYDEESQL